MSSRMTKFLKQTATIQYLKRNSRGEPVLNLYGEPEYLGAITTCKCRRERTTRDVLTTGGAAKISTTKYFFDNSITIDIGDKVDNKPVLTVTDFVNSSGVNEGWEVTV